VALHGFQRYVRTILRTRTIPLWLVILLLRFFFTPFVFCPGKQCLWSILPMLMAIAPLMMKQQTRLGRNISSARSCQTRSHLSLYSLRGSQALTLLWPRGRENGSSIWFRETLASVVIFKLNNTAFFFRHLLQVNLEWLVVLKRLMYGVAEPQRVSHCITSHQHATHGSLLQTWVSRRCEFFQKELFILYTAEYTVSVNWRVISCHKCEVLVCCETQWTA